VLLGVGKYNLMERGHLESLSVDGRLILKRIFNILDWDEWTGLIWLRIGKDGGLL